MADARKNHLEPAVPCGCFASPNHFLVQDKYLGMDAAYAEATLLLCPDCGQHWLRYFYEVEAFSMSGRWYLGAISAEQAVQVTAKNSKGILEGMGWYFYGGSYYRGKSGRTSGGIFLNP